MAFPAGSGYDLGLLGGGGPDGVVVVPPGGPWQDAAFDALRGAGSGEEYLQVDSTVVQAADPTAASVVQDGWSVVSPSQEGSGSPENRWQQVEAALSAGLLTPERVIAARVHESVFVPLPLLPGWDMAALLEARLESGQPFFGSVHLDRVAAGGQVLVTFPAGSGYDLGLLGGGGPDGVVVVPPGGRYRLTGVVPDYPAPGNTWFTLDADALSDYLVGSRDIQHRVDEEVAQSLAMLGEEAAHTLAQSLTREHGYQPPRGGVGGTPVREPGLATDRGISSPVLGTSRNSNAGAVMPGRNDYIRVRALSPETQKRLYDAIREVSAAAGPGSMSLRQIGKAAVARLRREGVISDRTRGSYLMSHHLNS
jgi:hypothetical protein